MLNILSLRAAKRRGNPCIFKIFQHVCLIGDQKYMDCHVGTYGPSRHDENGNFSLC